MDDQKPPISYALPTKEGGIAHFDPARTSGRSGWRSSILLLKTLGWGLLACVIIILVLDVVQELGGRLISFPATVFVLMMFPVTAMAARTIRKRRAIAVLGYLRQAVDLNLPFGRILIAAAKGERGVMARRLLALKNSIEDAVPLSSALAITVPEMPVRAVGLIRYAESVGRLPQTLNRLVREEVRAATGAEGDQALTRWYPPILLLLGGAIIVFYCAVVAPKFEWIFADFHVPLPRLTRWLFESQDYMWPFMILVWLTLAIMAGVQLRAVFRSRVMERPFSGFIDRLLWRLPILHAMQVDHAMADVCRAVGDALAVGRPIDEALREAQKLSLNIVMRQRVGKWADGVTAGLSPEDAARKAQIPAFVSGILSTSRSMANQDEVFEFLHRYYRSRFRLRDALLKAATIPAIVLVMGCFVTLVALSLFMPLITLTDSLSKLGSR